MAVKSRVRRLGRSCRSGIYEVLLSLSLLPRAATDHNSDNTTALLKEWLTVMQQFYHYVEWRPMEQPT